MHFIELTNKETIYAFRNKEFDEMAEFAQANKTSIKEIRTGDGITFTSFFKFAVHYNLDCVLVVG